MADWHSIDIKAGPYVWHVVPDAEGQLGDVLAGLKVSTNYDEEHPVQGAPGPWSASFEILVDDLADLADLRMGSPVSILAWHTAPGSYLPADPSRGELFRPPLVQFIGSVAELAAAPGAKGRTTVTVLCVDKLADLTNITVGDAGYPQETVADRFDRMFGEARLPIPAGHTLYGTVAARDAQPKTFLEAVQELLSWNVDPITESAYYLAPNPVIDYGPPIAFGDTLDPALPYTIALVFKYYIHGNNFVPRELAFRFVDGPNGYTVLVDGYPDDCVIPASLVELDTAFSKTKAGAVDRSLATMANGFTWRTEWNDRIPIEYRVDTELDNSNAAASLSLFNLPDSGIDSWGNDSLKILDIPLTMAIGWFCQWAQANDQPRKPVVISGVNPAQNPNGRSWITGMLRNATIVFGEDGWTIEAQLRPDLPRASADYSDPSYFEPYLSPRNMKSNGNLLSANQATLETSVADWATAGDTPPALARTLVAPLQGAASGLVTWAAGAGGFPRVQTNTATNLLVGNQYTASALVKITPGSVNVRIGVFGVANGSATTQSANPERISVTFTATADTHQLWLFAATAPAAGQSFRFDEVKVEPLDQVTPFVNPLSLITVADLDPDLTVYDLRLARRP